MRCTTMKAGAMSVLVVALLAFAGPAAGAGSTSQQTSVRDKLGEIGAWAVPSASQTSVREKLGEIGAWAVPADGNATARHAGTPNAARPDDRAGIRGPSMPEALPQPGQVGDHAGFNWGDAGIGGAATLALVLLVAGGAALRYTGGRQEAHG